MEALNECSVSLTLNKLSEELFWRGIGNEDLVFTYICTLFSATITVCVGSFVSLSQTSKTKQKPENQSNSNIVKVKNETMTQKDAYMFPLIGSCILLGLYISFQYFSVYMINLTLSLYFLIFSIISLNTSVTSFIYWLIPNFNESHNYSLNYNNHLLEREINCKFKMIDLVCMTGSIIFSFWYAWNKNWIANNIFGLSFSIQAISVISPGTYFIGCILLSGLFIYDIFWVFGTEVMVTVARSFDGPIKLLFPKNFFTAMKMNVPFEFSMLGLGDIVIPGIFIAMLLRFDVHYRNKGRGNFKICLVSYFFGLLVTICIMHYSKHPQPALLYLVPFCIISSLLSAALRGDLARLFKYTEIIDTASKRQTSFSNRQQQQHQPVLSFTKNFHPNHNPHPRHHNLISFESSR